MSNRYLKQQQEEENSLESDSYDISVQESFKQFRRQLDKNYDYDPEDLNEMQFDWIRPENYKHIPNDDWRSCEKQIKDSRDLCSMDHCAML
ncbi:unnamed protein product [Blepharisma stoltei]|uniref:Uncharacterized protein n=1 Tax=Blepharisma stoltei TaxID=1481888 RepID=A0AAU9JSD6_9CILI|nr:unnamed protein product [Blepharisma stoltei]